MRILIHGINYFPELAGIGKYTGEMAEWLVNRGIQIRVVSTPPYYPDWKIGKPYSGFLYRKEIINGVSVFRCPLWERWPHAVGQFLGIYKWVLRG